jgi:hypothetical protein
MLVSCLFFDPSSETSVDFQQTTGRYIPENMSRLLLLFVVVVVGGGGVSAATVLLLHN